MRSRLPQNRLGWLYGLLVFLLLAMGVWWVYFVTHEAQVQGAFQQERLAADRLHALMLIDLDPRFAADPQVHLGGPFPELEFSHQSGQVSVRVRPEILEQIDSEMRRARNMFLSEGLFFLLLLLAGTSILIHAWRSELRFKQARELFLAGATHEFKTPLASLRLYTETLGRSELPAEDRQHIRSRMIEDVVRLESLVDDLLALSADDTFGSGPIHDLDVAEECRSVVDQLQRYATDRGARIGLDAPDGCTIRGQQLVFDLALRNLVVNAIKHGEVGVKIDITLERGEDWHRVRVNDNGPGIPRRLHEKIFDCFYSDCAGAGSTKGAGLGLYLVKRNVESLGGRVELVSEKGQGASFILHLPAAANTTGTQDTGGGNL